MKKLRITDITNSAAMPMKSGSLEHIQNAYLEAMSSIVTSTIIPAYQYSTNVGYRLWGCENTTTGSTFTIGQGAIFFNGEIYQVSAVTFTVSGGQTAVGVLDITQYTGNGDNADPVQFTDGNQYNIHDIRKIKFQAGNPNSGLFDYNNSFDLRAKPQGCIGQIVNIQLLTSDISSNFDNTGLGTSERFKGWAIANGNNGTYNMKGRVAVGYDPSDGDFNVLGYRAGEKTHLLTYLESGLPEHNHLIDTSGETDTDPARSIKRTNANGDGYVDGVGIRHLISGVNGGARNADNAHNNLQPYAVMLMIVRIY